MNGLEARPAPEVSQECDITWHIDLAKFFAWSPERLAWYRALLERAITVFATEGIRGAQIKQITEEAGVSRTQFYWAWASKEDCFGACLRASLAELEKRLAAATSTKTGDTWRSELREIVKALLAFVDSNRDLTRFLLVASNEVINPQLRAEYERYLMRAANVVSSYLRHVGLRSQERTPPLIALESVRLIIQERVAAQQTCRPAAREILTAFLAVSTGWAEASRVAETVMAE